MEGNILESLGGEVVSIVTPVSICMLLVVLLVQCLSPHGGAAPVASIAMLVYDENSTDSLSEKLGGALLNALAFVVIVAMVTFLLVGLFYFRCTKCLRLYMGFSAFMVLAYMGGGVAILLIQTYSIPIDVFTFLVVVGNFATVGVLAVFFCKMPIVLTQGYLVLIGTLVAYWFTMLPEWTTWVLLMAMALYDVVAVLVPGGPLNMLVELAIARDEDIPALIYEARPVTHHLVPVAVTSETAASDSNFPPRTSSSPQRWRRRTQRTQPVVTSRSATANPATASRHGELGSQNDGTQVRIGLEGQIEAERQILVQHDAMRDSIPSFDTDTDLPTSQRILSRDAHGPTSSNDDTIPLHLTIPLDGIEAENRVSQSVENFLDDVVGLELEGGVLSGAIKLGLGDFIFYSLLVGRAAMYDMMTVYASYLAIVAGLGSTLVLLAVWKRALPALPISISLGILFYFLTRLILDPFAVNLATHLVSF